jgi:hypothetical protein
MVGAGGVPSTKLGTGEPPTSPMPSGRANHLGTKELSIIEWSGRAELNRRPSEPHSDALTRLRYAPFIP